MSRITGVIVALATTAVVLTGSTTAAAPAPAPARELPRDIPGGVEVTLADGDLFRVWTSKDHRVVWGKRRDAVAGAWGPRREVLRVRNLRCGDVDVRTANGAVAVLAECDTGSYHEDQAPDDSRALWSVDTVTWSSYELEGEAYEEPGISPDGTKAVFLDGDGYVTFGAAGFTEHPLEAPGQEYTGTATITDDEQVSYLYGDSIEQGCRLVVLTRTGTAAPSRQELSVADACSESDLANVDAHTAWFGGVDEPANRVVVARADASAPWAVTEIAPTSAPGLERVERGLGTDFVTAPGLPLVALSSRDRRSVRAQIYDRAAQSWRPPVVVFSARKRCSWDGTWTAEPLGVLVAELRCGGHRVVLTPGDGVAWRALRSGTHPLGLSPDGRYVAVPGRDHTYVVSAELGVTALPGGVTGRCEVVVPDGPRAAVLLTAAGRHRGWPTVLKQSTADGWRTLSRTRLPTFEPACQRARTSSYGLPYRFDVSSRWKGYSVQVRRSGDTWIARRHRF